MVDIENWISHQESKYADILDKLHHWIISFPGLEPKIRYKVPFYYKHSWICYMNPLKPEGVELVFLRGIELVDDLNLLDAKDRKQVKGISFFSPEEIDFELLRVIMLEAIILDETVPYRSKRKK